ncbi:MAG: response regulator [Chitinispirillaceae bacterium]|nr:response regulator [Chitinispirillaceae bacterium]
MSFKTYWRKEAGEMLRNNPYQLTTMATQHRIKGTRHFFSGTDTMKKGKRILVIDDEEVISFGFSMVLKEPGVEVDCAQTAEDARNLIAAHRYDVAIIDLRLSDSTEMEGFDCIRLLRSSQSNCRVIVLTAYGDNEVREQATALGVNRFFEKPMEPEILREALASFGVYRN